MAELPQNKQVLATPLKIAEPPFQLEISLADYPFSWRLSDNQGPQGQQVRQLGSGDDSSPIAQLPYKAAGDLTGHSLFVMVTINNLDQKASTQDMKVSIVDSNGARDSAVFRDIAIPTDSSSLISGAVQVV